MEAKGLEFNYLREEIFKNNAKTNEEVAANITNILQLEEKKDIKNLDIYINTLTHDLEGDFDGFKQKLLSLFTELMIYDQAKELRYQKRIKRVS